MVEEHAMHVCRQKSEDFERGFSQSSYCYSIYGNSIQWNVVWEPSQCCDWKKLYIFMITIMMKTNWKNVEAAGKSNFNKGFLFLIFRASASLHALFPHTVRINAFCHPSHGEVRAFAGHFASLHSSWVSFVGCALASVAACVCVLSSKTYSR